MFSHKLTSYENVLTSYVFLKMREILVIVIYKGGGGWRHAPPWKIFQTEMSFTAFSKKINVFLQLQNIIKISNETTFTSVQRQLCVLFCYFSY